MSARDLASLTHAQYDKPPLRWWHYTDRFATAGFRDREGKKHIYAAAKIGEHWLWHTPMSPLPIYGAAALVARPDAPVLVFESESLADAAGGLFSDHVCVAWALGTSHVNAADIVPFENRDVVLWPGSDGASITAMERLRVRLNNYARSLTTLAAPRTWPVSWLEPPPLPPDAVIKELRRALRNVSPLRDVPEPQPVVRSDDLGADDRTARLLPRSSHADSALRANAGQEARGPGEESTDEEDDSHHAENALAAPAEPPPADTDDWPTSDLSLPEGRCGDRPAFPLDALPRFWRAWAAQAARSDRAPVDHVALSLLSAAAGLIGGIRRIAPVPTWSEPCVLWTALVGSPGKVPGMATVLRLMRALDGDLVDANAAAQRRHRTALETARAEGRWWLEGVRGAVANHRPPPEIPAVAEEPPPFAPRQLVIDDPDSLVEALQGSARGTLLALGALDTWWGSTARAAAGGQPGWSRWWSADPWTVKRRGRPAAGAPRGIAIPCAAVSIVGALPASAIAAALTGGCADMTARFLFAWPRRAAFHALTGVAAIDDDAAREALARLRDMPDAPREVPLAPEALAPFDAFACRLDAEADGPEGWAADWRDEGTSLVLRLAGVLTFLAWAAQPSRSAEPAYIPAVAIQAAIALWQDYLWPHAQAVLCAGGGSEPASHVRQVLQWLAAERPSEVSREQIRREALREAINAAGADKVIALLVERDCLRPVTYTTAGRSRHRWQVNPAMFLPSFLDLSPVGRGGASRASRPSRGQNSRHAKSLS